MEERHEEGSRFVDAALTYTMDNTKIPNTAKMTRLGIDVEESGIKRGVPSSGEEELI